MTLLATLPAEVAIDPLVAVFAACITVAIIALIGLWLLLKGLSSFRANLSDELRRLIAPDPAKQIEVQQPLVVKKHDPCASAEELLQVHGRIKREKAETDAKLAALVEEDRRLREHVDNHHAALNERIDAIPARTIALLNETKQLHKHD